MVFQKNSNIGEIDNISGKLILAWNPSSNPILSLTFYTCLPCKEWIIEVKTM